MTPSSENRNTYNLINYINEHFKTQPYILNTNKISTLLPSRPNFFLNKTISMVNTQLEGNLRVLETYMPELLYSLLKNIGSKALYFSEALQLSSQVMEYDTMSVNVKYLKMKLRNWFDAILFSDFGVNEWNGKAKSNRCFILNNNTLSIFDSNYILNHILDNSYIQKSLHGKGILQFRLSLNSPPLCQNG